MPCKFKLMKSANKIFVASFFLQKFRKPEYLALCEVGDHAMISYLPASWYKGMYMRNSNGVVFVNHAPEGQGRSGNKWVQTVRIELVMYGP